MTEYNSQELLDNLHKQHDMESFLAIYQDKEVNTYLPWLPLETMVEAQAFEVHFIETDID